jgi:hypothetical protein
LSISTSSRHGWEIVHIRTTDLEVEVLPGKGGDVLQIRRREDDLDVLWTSPWGLRPRGAWSAANESEGRLMEAYPGGWQTVFPNGGDASPAHGTVWGMHGEVWLSPFDWERSGPSGITMHTRLVHSPFSVTKDVQVAGSHVTICETITNCGRHPVDVMWSHHPAFGAPLLSADSIVDTPDARIVIDDVTPSGRTDVGSAAGGGATDLRWPPNESAAVARMAYLIDLVDGSMHLRNPRLGAGALITWDTSVMPHAWYWLECHGSPDFPWYQQAYVLGLEPASSYPAQGLGKARERGSTMTFRAGERRSATVSLTVTDGTA